MPACGKHTPPGGAAARGGIQKKRTPDFPDIRFFFCNGCPLFFIATFRLAFFLAAFAFFLAAFFLAAVAFLFLAALLGLWFVTLFLLIGALG